jgi:hypothetical protein
VTEKFYSKTTNLLTADIKDFFLNTIMDTPHYFSEKLEDIPEEIIREYDLEKLKYTDFKNVDRIMFEVNKGLYGLPHASRMAQIQINQHLKKFGFFECDNTPCLYRNQSGSVYFTLVVDDFCIYYRTRQDAENLIKVIEQEYILTTDWDCKSYLGMNIVFKEDHSDVSISIPGYVERAIKRFLPENSTNTRKSPSIYISYKFSENNSEFDQLDPDPKVDNLEFKWLQQLVGTFLYYARAVDPSIIVAVTKLASELSQATKATIKKATHLLEYMNTYPNASIRYRPSTMKIIGQSDASYLSESHARSRWGYLFYCQLLNPENDYDINGTIECMSLVSKVVVSSACEAEYGGIFVLAKKSIPFMETVSDLGYPQSMCTLITDNKPAITIAEETKIIGTSKSFDMRFHWIKDRVNQKQFELRYWETEYIQADFLTKIFPGRIFLEKRKQFVYDV